MKRKLIETGYDILIILINHLLMIALGMILMALLKQESHGLWLWTVLVILPIFLYWARCALHNFFLFFAVHLVLPGMVLLLPVGIVIKVIVMLITVIYIIWSIYIRIKTNGNREELLAPMFAILALAGITLIENLYCKMGWEGLYLLLAILYVSGYFLYCFIEKYLHFLLVNESSAANIPEKEIFTSGMKQTLSFIVMGGAALLITANISWVGYLLSMIGKVVVMILKILLSGLSSEEPKEVEQIMTNNMRPDMSVFDEYTEPHWIWKFLEKVMMIAVFMLLVGLLIFVLVKGFRYLWKQFHISARREEKKIQTGIDIRESCVIEKTKKEESHWFAFLNNREKVRRIYKKKILKHRADIIGDLNQEKLQYLTAKECCDKLVTDTQISSGILKRIYEKARYSKEEINAEDIKLLRSAGK